MLAPAGHTADAAHTVLSEQRGAPGREVGGRQLCPGLAGSRQVEVDSGFGLGVEFRGSQDHLVLMSWSLM